jgi:hypothetical protein
MISTPHYVAKKVGDEYQIVRDDAVGRMETPAFTVGGTGLILMGFARRGLFGGLMALGGAALIYRGIQGEWPLCCGDALSRRRASKASSDASPTHQHDGHAPDTQRPMDEVDEASMESFPASDPPARMTPAPQKGGVLSPSK